MSKQNYINSTKMEKIEMGNALTLESIKSKEDNFYIGVNKELRITNKQGFNDGGAITYLPVRASKFISVSSKKYKTNIKDVELDPMALLKGTKVKQYNLKTDLADGIEKTKYGVILEDTNEALRDGDGIDTYSMLSILWKVVQEQQDRIEQLENRGN